MIIAALGTSLTNQAGWLQSLQGELTTCSGQQITLLDFGQSGATSEWGLAVVGEVIESRPDVVLIEFAANDAALIKGLSLRQSLNNVGKIVRTIKKALPRTRVFLMTMNPFWGVRGFIRPRINRYYDLYKRLAEEYSIGYVDSRQSWRNLTKAEVRSGIPDGAHPRPEVVSQILVPLIIQAICE